MANRFNKHGNASTLKYRRESTPNIKFQPDRIFVRNDLFKKIIKSCKAPNAEFPILKEKLGICPYEENYNEEEIIKINIKESFNKLLDESDHVELIKELNKELGKELNLESDKESYKESDKETSDEELIEIIILRTMKIQQIGMIKTNLRKYLLLLTAINSIIKIK